MYRLIPSGRIRLMLLTAALVIWFHVFFAAAAQAHSLTISATASCNDSGVAVINYTATSYDTTTIHGSNSEIDISVNNVFVESGVFALPGNTFSGSFLAPSGSSAIVTAVAVGFWNDGWGPGQSASTTVDIPTDCGSTTPGVGRFTGGGSQIVMGGTSQTSQKGGSKASLDDGSIRITRGLTIHCDLLLSNNLEVNWSGHQFHMEDHMTTVACTDDPAIIQTPPSAPIDTLKGIGIGRYDNIEGYTIEFTLVDAGEPGALDQMAIRIYETANPGNVVLDVPLQVLSGGNLQAHYDQPHKK